MLANGRMAIEGLSGRLRVGFDESTMFFRLESAGSRSSRTAPTKRMPLRANVLIRRCSSPLSEMACRAALMQVVNADSETMRPSHTEESRSSLLTTRSRFRIT
jgi:hypothetical protein